MNDCFIGPFAHVLLMRIDESPRLRPRTMENECNFQKCLADGSKPLGFTQEGQRSKTLGYRNPSLTVSERSHHSREGLAAKVVL